MGPDFAAENTQFISDDLEDAALAGPSAPQSAVNTSSAWETFAAEVDARQGQRVPLRTLSAGNQREFKTERRGAFSERWAKASAEVGRQVGSLASSSRPLQELQAEAQQAEAQAAEMEAEAEAEAEAEVGELEAEVEAEKEAEAEAAAAKAEARTFKRLAKPSTFDQRLAQAKVDVEANPNQEAAKPPALVLEAPAQEPSGALPMPELDASGNVLDASGEPILDVPALTRPPAQEAELAKLDASVARDVQAELSKMDAQDAQSELAARKFAHAVALDSQQQQQAQQQQAQQAQQAQQGQQAAQALEAAIGARSFAERQRAVLVAERTEAAMRAKADAAEAEAAEGLSSQQAAMEEGYAALMSEPSLRQEASERALRQKRALQQKWRRAEAEGYSP